MSFLFVPGNALGCVVNGHRHRWNGSICEQASSWNCGAEGEFRSDYCERGDPRCFHLHVFESQRPHLVIPQSGVGWILDTRPQALDDQILLLWGPQFQEPRGIRDPTARVFQVFGAYRVQSVERKTVGPHVQYQVVPYPDAAVEFQELRVPRPYYHNAGGPYIKQVERRALDRVFEDARAAADRDWSDGQRDDARRRLAHFHDHLDPWLRVAAAKSHRHLGVSAPKESVVAAPVVENRAFRPFTKLLESRVVEEALPPRGAVTPVPIQPVVPKAVPLISDLVEPGVRPTIVERYGEDTLLAILVGSLTKTLVAFRGEPGVGKSTLALDLLDDPKRERTLVVPVSPTWRGPEDLLGYVNPVTHRFEARQFTRFLYAAAAAWDQGDRRNRLVIFEEFNLSPPEYWLSDILVRAQYPEQNRRERTIELGGSEIVGVSGADPAGVYLAPSVRFVATMNSDLSTRPLSPRVLDRLAIVELAMEPRRALVLVGLDLEPPMIDAISDLNFIVKPKAATFSLRTAMSLKRCWEHREALQLDEWSALDLVLLQEVLTKVRLLAGDPSDLQVIRELQEWSELVGPNLRRCGSVVAGWKEALEENRDVIQA